MKNYPKVRKFFKYMLKETLSEESREPSRGKCSSHDKGELKGKGKTSKQNPIPKGVNNIKSPSNMTIYAPALNRQMVNAKEMSEVNQISEFVE